MTHFEAPPCAPERLWEIAADPSRVAALHGLVGSFCHLLRNRLNSLQMVLYLAQRDDLHGVPDSWDELNSAYRQAERAVELFQTVCRPLELMPIPTNLGAVLKDFLGRWSPRFEAAGRELVWELSGPDSPTWVDPSRLNLGLDGVAAWRLARSEPGSVVRLRAGRGGLEPPGMGRAPRRGRIPRRRTPPGHPGPRGLRATGAR